MVLTAPALESDFRCLRAPQITWYYLAPKTSPPAWFSLQIWGANGGIQPCPAKPTGCFLAWGCAGAHLPSRDRSIPSNCFRSHLGRKGWTDGEGLVPPDGDQKCDLLVLPHLSICSGVWAFWVSTTSQLRPVIHRLMSSSQKAGGGRGGW